MEQKLEIKDKGGGNAKGRKKKKKTWWKQQDLPVKHLLFTALMEFQPVISQVWCLLLHVFLYYIGLEQKMTQKVIFDDESNMFYCINCTSFKNLRTVWPIFHRYISSSVSLHVRFRMNEWINWDFECESRGCQTLRITGLSCEQI